MSTEKVNVLIVEDEALVALDLCAGLEREGYNVIGTADSAEEAEQLFAENDVDIILMDINIIGDKDGIATAIDLLKVKQVPVIYLTALSDTATVNRVKQSHPAAFLSKPYNINNVRIAVDIAINNFAMVREQKLNMLLPPVAAPAIKQPDAVTDKEMILQLNDAIFVKYNYRYVKIRFSELLYIEADNNNINVVTSNKKYLLRLSLNQLLEKINYPGLFRIHRSYAVNLEAISSFNDQSIFIDKIELPVGRNYRSQFLQQFKPH